MKSASPDTREMENPAEGEKASPLVVGLIALCAGITVSNLYLTQPLLRCYLRGLNVFWTTIVFLLTDSPYGFSQTPKNLNDTVHQPRRSGLRGFRLFCVLTIKQQ